MPNYRYFASYPRFFPDIRDVNGKSLEAKSGMVVAWDSPPPTAEWAETEEPVTWVADEMVPAHLPAPKPAQETFRNEPEPEAPVAVPEVPAEPTGPPEPVIVPEPSPVPETDQPALSADWFSALSGPPARA